MEHATVKKKKNLQKIKINAKKKSREKHLRMSQVDVLCVSVYVVS